MGYSFSTISLINSIVFLNISYVWIFSHSLKLIIDLKLINNISSSGLSLPLFSEIKDKIIKKHEKDGESFYENIYIFLKGFENRINKAKSRRKKKIIKTEGN